MYNVGLYITWWLPILVLSVPVVYAVYLYCFSVISCHWCDKTTKSRNWVFSNVYGTTDKYGTWLRCPECDNVICA